MTASDVLLDTTAWWELLAGTAKGRKLRARHFDGTKALHTSALALGEVAAKLASMGAHERIEETLDLIRSSSRVHPVTDDVASAAGPLRAVLRRAHADASLVDAVMLATARHVGATLVSDDRAFAKQKDVEGF